MQTTTDRVPNRLINEKSPYLLQHAHNPVDWFPWSDEAFEKAKKEDKPIFLSIGYSTCHWCHIMERESFEHQDVADILNRSFVSIKVDREERSDIDHIYMTFCQMLTGQGGWPLTIIMTPDQKPFFTGTYFPKDSRMGMPGLIDILNRVQVAWHDNKGALINSGEQIVEHLFHNFMGNDESGEITRDLLNEAYNWLSRTFESNYGGFSRAPKFPTPHSLLFLLRYWKVCGERKAFDMVEKTLDSMYRGGIFDHIGYGFSRYSTDNKWLVPHFEKMLYDNALLAIAYLEAYQATKKEVYAEVANKIFTYVLRDMLSPEGGFYSAEDADSEAEEGKFYLWTPDEIIHILKGEDGQMFCEYYDITAGGNFQGKSIPNRINAKKEVNDKEELFSIFRERVFTHRERRIHPYKDDKILTSWNGLMIAAMAIGGRALANEIYTKAAEKAVAFIFDKLIREDDRLLARYRDGEAAYPGYVDDYAFFIWGLIELYQTTYKPEYLQKAIKLNDDMIKYFWDSENGGLFIYGNDNEQLIARPKEVYDGAQPSGNSVAALNFLRLARITGDEHMEHTAQQQLKAFGKTVEQMPGGYTYFLIAVMFALYPTQEIVITGERSKMDTRQMIRILQKSFLPHAVSILYSGNPMDDIVAQMIPFIKYQQPQNNKATAYICQNFACRAPVTDIKEFEDMIDFL